MCVAMPELSQKLAGETVKPGEFGVRQIFGILAGNLVLLDRAGLASADSAGKSRFCAPSATPVQGRA
jgi:hypothetical protein